MELQAAYADIYQGRCFSFTSEFFFDVKLQNWPDNIIYILLNKTSNIVLGLLPHMQMKWPEVALSARYSSVLREKRKDVRVCRNTRMTEK